MTNDELQRKPDCSNDEKLTEIFHYDQLADLCGKNVTLKGKLAERGGIAMVENTEVTKK